MAEWVFFLRKKDNREITLSVFEMVTQLEYFEYVPIFRATRNQKKTEIRKHENLIVFFFYKYVWQKSSPTIGFQNSRANNRRNMSLFVFVFLSYFVLRLDFSTCVNQIKQNKTKKYVIFRNILQVFRLDIYFCSKNFWQQKNTNWVII